MVASHCNRARRHDPRGRLLLLAVAPLLAVAFLTMSQNPAPQEPAPSLISRPSGVKGIVVLWPICPVERLDAHCGSRPAQATVRIRDRVAGTLAATVHSGRDGRFHAAVPPGTYSVRAEVPSVTVCRPVDAIVMPGAYTDLTIRCDTGIR